MCSVPVSEECPNQSLLSEVIANDQPQKQPEAKVATFATYLGSLERLCEDKGELLTSSCVVRHATLDRTCVFEKLELERKSRQEC